MEILTVGHITVDSIITGEGPPVLEPGGPPVYVSLAADPSIALPMSVVGTDFPANFRKRLSTVGLKFQFVRTVREPTSSFVIRTKRQDRELRLTRRCRDIEFMLSNITCKAIHLGSVAGEISTELALRLGEPCEVLSIDPQGFIRSFSGDGRVHLTTRVPRRLLKKCNIFKGSAEEVQKMTGRSSLSDGLRKVQDMGPEIVIATLGGSGAAVSGGGLTYSIPAYATKMRDPTGAGDAFIGGFLREYLRSGDLVWSAVKGSASASYAVEGFGPWKLSRMIRLEERAQSIYEGVSLLR